MNVVNLASAHSSISFGERDLAQIKNTYFKSIYCPAVGGTLFSSTDGRPKSIDSAGEIRSDSVAAPRAPCRAGSLHVSRVAGHNGRMECAHP